MPWTIPRGVRRFFSLAAAISLAAAVNALEIQNLASYGNLAFDSTRETSLGSALFSPNPYWAASIQISERIDDSLAFSLELERDPLLRNLVRALVNYDLGFVRLSAGPFFGPFNTADLPLSAGLSISARLEVAGILYGSFRSDSTIGAGASINGDYIQQSSELSAGFWLPNILLSVRLANDMFAHRLSQEKLIVDRRTRYELVIDIFKKNIPYTVHLNAGYDSLRRSYQGASSAENAEDQLDSIILGGGLTILLNQLFKMDIAMEATPSAWGVGGIAGPAASAFLFELTVGATITIPKK